MPEPTKTLRDEFAMAALPGLIKNGHLYSFSVETIAKKSYEYAKAMLAERAKADNQ